MFGFLRPVKGVQDRACPALDGVVPAFLHGEGQVNRLSLGGLAFYREYVEQEEYVFYDFPRLVIPAPLAVALAEYGPLLEPREAPQGRRNEERLYNVLEPYAQEGPRPCEVEEKTDGRGREHADYPVHPAREFALPEPCYQKKRQGDGEECEY